jgi:hypothetical protein
MKPIKSSVAWILLFVLHQVSAQNDLLDELPQDSGTDTPVTATFKGTRLVNGHTVELRQNGVLEFIIGHRFGLVNQGGNQFWGLDNATIRLGLDYSLTDNLGVGIGRASADKVYDGYVKYRFLRQSGKTPVSALALGSIVYQTVNPYVDEPMQEAHRYSYTAQMLIARKLSSRFSIQLMPTLIQRNWVATSDDENGLIALGIGGRMKLSNRIAFNVESYPQLTNYSDGFANVFSIGFDIETGGHVFQLHLTNAQQMNEPGFIGETTGRFFDGDISFGFNITRVFDLKAGKDKKW